MNKISTLFIIIVVVIFTSLAACTSKNQEPGPISTVIPQPNLPNPASAFCERDGNKLVILTSTDGSQSGVCIFPDGSTCDEWAYFRGECSMKTQANPKLNQTKEPTPKGSGGYMQPGTSEPIEDWWGIIRKTPPGAQYDDYFERQDLGQIINFGIDSLEPTVKAQIVALRNSDTIVHLYGTLFSNVPDYNGSQIQVVRIEVEK